MDHRWFAVNGLRLVGLEGAAYPGATRLLVTAMPGSTATGGAVEGPARRPGRRDRAGDQRRALPARYEQVEPDRAPAVLPHHPHLARPPADDGGRRRGLHRRHRDRPGPECTAVRDDAAYPAGAAVSDERMRYLTGRVLVRHGPHRPATTPSCPPPGPPRTRTRSRTRPAVPRETLNHPALTGLDPRDLHALAAALQVPFGARREHDSYARRGRRRSTPPNPAAPHGNRAPPDRPRPRLRLREHLHLTVTTIGALLGVDSTTISHATTLPPG